MAPEGYGTHRDYMDRVSTQAGERVRTVEKAIREAFAPSIRKEEVEVVVFADVPAQILASALERFPIILKPLLVASNVAARVIERDLMIKNLDTYTPRLDHDKAALIAGYLKPYLPDAISIPTLSHSDRVEFIDKEIRKGKGRWEHEVVAVLNRFATVVFKKRRFAAGKKYELDAAAPTEGPILYGVDVKRIEARRDIHKRCDEIAQKAAKFKAVTPDGLFGAVIYYPFPLDHSNLRDRGERQLHRPTDDN